jgi:hypothetical protein
LFWSQSCVLGVMWQSSKWINNTLYLEVTFIFFSLQSTSVRKGDDLTTFVVLKVEKIRKPWPTGFPRACSGL